ncbi:ankyrin repeat-containing domain protein [Triangularia verruculosa]|uniref:Ankyrin repeat-containing domain protein n=1 Tax=Triangularia verruculosa TaxID=2587418 RepID=A0AAN6X9V9_9PEZI|nr:ankyrin repeat-containing domain protein [Triangularia verruculosa]
MSSDHSSSDSEADKTPPLIKAAKENDAEEVKRLLDQGEDVNVRDEAYYGQTAISWAAEKGHLGIVKILYEHDARLDILDCDGNSPVYWAIEKDNTSVIEYFLANAKEKDLTHKCGAGRSLLFVATEFGVVDDVKRFLGSDPNERDDDGLTPLMFAALYSRNTLPNAIALLEAGADPLLEDNSGATAIYYAFRGMKADLAELLLNKLGDDFKVNGSRPGAGPLIEAAKQGVVSMIPILRLLLDRKPELELPDEDGKTPLYWAAKLGRIEAVCALIEAGADPYRLCRPPIPNGDWNLTAFAIAATDSEEEWRKFIHQDPKPDLTIRNDERGGTAFHVAAFYGVSEAAIRRMIVAGYGPDVPDMEGRTPLMLAADQGHSSIVALLLEHNPDTEVTDNRWDRTPLMCAAANGHDQVVEQLIPISNIEARDSQNSTVLHFAASSCSVNTVEALIKAAPALIDAGNSRGLTPLSWAVIHERPEAVRALIRAGANIYRRDFGGTRTAIARAAGNLDLIKAFIEEKRENTPPEIKETPRVRVVQLALRYACENNFSPDRSIFPLDNKDHEKYLLAVDGHGRNLVSWVAQYGRSEEMQLLSHKTDLSFRTADELGRTPLHWVAQNQNSDTSELTTMVRCLLDLGVPRDSKDKLGRTPLSYAAEVGLLDVMSLLIRKGADPDSADNRKRTVLSWAAEGGNDACVQSLLSKKGVWPDSRDVDGRTPLSWAAGMGRSDIVKTLLARRDENAPGVDSSDNQDKKGVRTTRDAGVDINSRDNQSWTPLWYAADSQHLAVFEILLLYGAKSDIKDNKGRVLKDYLEDKIQTIPVLETRTLRAMFGKLNPSGFLWREASSETTQVDNEFSATLLYMSKSDIEIHTPTVASVLRGDRPYVGYGMTCAWTHLPANNMRWVEVLMAKHFEASGESWRSNIVLKPRLWEQQQHKSQDGQYHARFMRPACRPFTFLEQDSTDPGLVFFMPYLHWEQEEEQRKLKNVIAKMSAAKKEKFPSDAAAKEHRQKLIRAALADNNLCGTEQLYWAYLDEEHPLHGRRTLDQYYYHTLADTKKRDEDQTSLRYFNERKHTINLKEMKPTITMVDQLWMWVLPEYGTSPRTIITAFPQRSNRMSTKISKIMTSLVSNIFDRFRELSAKGGASVDELARLIVAECARIYFEPMSNRNELIQFVEIYRTSIGEITEDEINRFQSFQDNIQSADEAGDDSDGPKTTPTNVDFEVPKKLEAMIDIKADIEDLRKIKDIRDELHIISSIFHIQKNVAETLDHLLEELKDRRNAAIDEEPNFGAPPPPFRRRDFSRPFTRDGSRPFRRRTPPPPPPPFPPPSHRGFRSPSRRRSPDVHAYDNAGTEQDMDRRNHHSPMFEVVNRNIAEVLRLEKFAERAAQAIEQLLDLKHKQANLQLTRGIYKINDENDRQGKTIMYFTVATIIFLPLSFMASFLTIEVEEFPRGDSGNLSLDFVITIILAISIALIIPSVILAFNLDKRTRDQRWDNILKSFQHAKGAVWNGASGGFRAGRTWLVKNRPAKQRDPEVGGGSTVITDLNDPQFHLPGGNGDRKGAAVATVTGSGALLHRRHEAKAASSSHVDSSTTDGIK